MLEAARSAAATGSRVFRTPNRNKAASVSPAPLNLAGSKGARRQKGAGLAAEQHVQRAIGRVGGSQAADQDDARTL